MKDMIPREKKVLTLSGSSYEIGRKHGIEAKKQVHVSLMTYEKLFQEFSSIAWHEAREKALAHVKEIEKYYPLYLEEMDGLANGAGVAFEDILILNARSEIALTTAPDGCTSFALTSPKTSKTWLAQNWDWKGSQIDSLIHLKIEQNNLPVIEMVTEAGIIGKIGSNSAGIGVCLNALTTDSWQPKIPLHLGLRAILESVSLKEAVSKVADNQMASPAHFLIASSSEGIASMEVSPVHTAKITSSDGMLVHTNHLCSTEMKKEMTEMILPDSFKRFSVIAQQVQSLPDGVIEKEDLYRILSNHENYPNSICRHDSPIQSVREKMETVFSIVMNLTDNELSWSEGNPCENH